MAIVRGSFVDASAIPVDVVDNIEIVDNIDVVDNAEIQPEDGRRRRRMREGEAKVHVDLEAADSGGADVVDDVDLGAEHEAHAQQGVVQPAPVGVARRVLSKEEEDNGIPCESEKTQHTLKELRVKMLRFY